MNDGAAEPRRRWVRKGRWRLVVTGAVLVVAGSAIFAVITATADGQKVLVTTKPVEAGAVLEREDVRTVTVAADASAGLIAESQAATVIGEPVAVALVAGTFLTGDMVGPSQVPEVGKVRAALAVEPGQAPAGLSSGARVSVLVPATKPLSGKGKAKDMETVDGVVTAVTEANTGAGGKAVTVELAEADAHILAGAEAEQIMIVQTAPTRKG